MKPSTVAVALIAFGTFAATPAFADAERGFYIGAGVGQFNVQIDNVQDATDAVGEFDSDDTTFKVFAGWRFGKFIALELDYLDLGSPEDTVGNTKVNAEINGVAPYVVGTLPLGIFELFAKVGYYFYDVKINAESLGSLDDSNEDLAYGAGFGITLFEHLNARLEYEIIDISEVDDSNALWLTGAWRF